jgi:hypothetical protein
MFFVWYLELYNVLCATSVITVDDGGAVFLCNPTTWRDVTGDNHYIAVITLISSSYFTVTRQWQCAILGSGSGVGEFAGHLRCDTVYLGE